ncbi:MAG: glycosyltransferase [Phycisphaerae bacterium]|nr:glycosyltransferase [Phycisphaerae bacterium]
MSADASPLPTVSIVMATYARLDQLKQCLGAVHTNVTLPHETIVVGGAANDGTTEWLREQSDVRFIPETTREGATKAYNKGFRAARGTYVMWLNDDSYPLPGSVEAAVRTIERPDLTDVGMIAFYHIMEQPPNQLDEVRREGVAYRIFHSRLLPYANFGLLRRSLLERVGFLDERFYFCGWDPDLSLTIQLREGLRVVGCPDALIHHEELMDDRKKEDLAVFKEDNKRLHAKWPLWPCRIRRRRWQWKYRGGPPYWRAS